MAGTQVDEIDAALLTLKGIFDRPVWSEQMRESAVACQSFAVARPTIINNNNWPTNDSPGKALSGGSLANWNYSGGSVYANTSTIPFLPSVAS
jgi:hypothetical protein